MSSTPDGVASVACPLIRCRILEWRVCVHANESRPGEVQAPSQATPDFGFRVSGLEIRPLWNSRRECRVRVYNTESRPSHVREW